MDLVILTTILLFQTHAYIINHNNYSLLNEVSKPYQYFRSQDNNKHSKLYSLQVCNSISNSINEAHNPIANKYSKTKIHIQSLKSTMDDDQIEEEDYDEEDDYESSYDNTMSDDMTDYASDVDTPEPFEYNSRGELYVPAIQRLQRRRFSRPIRKVFRESLINTSNLILPLIVHNGSTYTDNDGLTIYSPNDAISKAASAKKNGITTFLLIPKIEDNLKNPSANEGYNHEGMFPLLISDIKDKIPNINIIADANVSNYTKEGYDGLVTIPGKIDNDATVQQVARQAVTLAEAGADMISISDILDGTTSITREILDMEGFTDVGLVSHAAKYSSTLLNYNESDVDKMTFLNDPSNTSDVEMKLAELNASDAVVIEPSMLYMDLISRVKKLTALPVIAYQSPGEVRLIKAACTANVIPEKNFVFEYLKSCIRAGANLIITHYAFDVALWLQDDLQQNEQLNISLSI